MHNIKNCPNCGILFSETKFRDVCDSCYKEEESKYEKVYNFMKKKDNFTANLEQVAEATDVKKELIIKFIKSGRLRIAKFPNLGYKCERCGATIRENRICQDCVDHIQVKMKEIENEERRKGIISDKEKRITYYIRKED